MRRFLKWSAIVVAILLLAGAAFAAGLVTGNTDLLTPYIVQTTNQPAQFSTFWMATSNLNLASPSVPDLACW